MQVGDLSRTHVPHERRDNATLQTMRVLLVGGFIAGGALALWRFQESGPATEGMVAAAPPQTIFVEPQQVANPPDRRPARVQIADAEPTAPIALPVKRPALVPLSQTDEEEFDESSDEAVIDTAALELSQNQSLSVLKQLEAVVRQSSRNEPAKPLPSSDMNMTGTVTRQASLAESYVPAGEPAATLIDLNKGSVEQLNNLKGAGSLGRAIVRSRPYKSVEDLVKKRVVRRTAYERIKDQVTVQ